MKRRIVRITAGAVFVLAWIAAGVYALWSRGPVDDSPKPPTISANEMSAQIAKANEEPEAGNVTSPAVHPNLAANPPAGNSLFRPSSATSAAANRQTTPSASTRPAYSGGYGSAYGDGYGDTAGPEVIVPTDVPAGYTEPEDYEEAEPAAGREFSPPPSAFAGNPLRGHLGAADVDEEIPAEEEADDRDAAPLAPPPSSFGSFAAPPNALPSSPAGTSSFGGNRFAAPPPGIQDEAEPDTMPQRGAASDQFGSLPTMPQPIGRTTNDSTPQAGTVASARPGNREFEGSQAPALVIEKFAPPEIQVGKPASFEIHVRNAGQATAQQVIVTDYVPAGTRLVGAKPQPQAGAGGSLAWQLGALEPGEEKTIMLELMPEKEGEIGSVAQVTFAAAAAARTVCTRPQLTVEQIGPSKVMIGEPVTLQITITNPGSGAATGVVLQEDVPEGLAHSAGKELEYEIGTLRPGESRTLELTLAADKAGLVQNTLVVRGDANLEARHTLPLEVIAPQLTVAMNGPKKRYLDRQATYTVSIANPGTAAARDVEIVAYLPKGMKFVSTDRQGQYDPQHHAVYWSLEELPPAQQGTAQLVAIPVEPGEQKLRVEGHAQLGLTTSDEEIVQVEAIPQLVFEIVDEADPIEVGAETVYLVRVTNIGSKAATNVQVAAGLPPELRPVAADGATRGAVQGQTVVFEPLGSLAPQAEAIFKIQATGLRTGDYTIRVQLASDDLQTPVTKEEHTRVYADR